MKDFFEKAAFRLQEEDLKFKKVSVFHQSETTQNAYMEVVEDFRSEKTGYFGDLSLIFNVKSQQGLPTINAVEAVNNKLLLRAFMRKYGYDMFNVDFFIVTENDEVNNNNFFGTQEKVAERLDAKAGEFFLQVKDVSAASGEGQFICNNWEDANKKITEYKIKHPGAIFMVEERVGIDVFKVEGPIVEGKEAEGSAQFGISEDENGEPMVDFFGLTKQYVIKNAHQGNGITYDKNAEHNQLLDEEQITMMKKLIFDIAKKLKYKGYIGIDFAKTKDGRIVIFEANARVTGSTYPLAVLNQLILSGASENTAVVSRNTIKPNREFKNIAELNKFLLDSGLLYNNATKTGVIPTMTTDLKNKVGVICVGGNLNQAEELLIKLRKLIDKTYEENK